MITIGKETEDKLTRLAGLHCYCQLALFPSREAEEEIKSIKLDLVKEFLPLFERLVAAGILTASIKVDPEVLDAIAVALTGSQNATMLIGCVSQVKVPGNIFLVANEEKSIWFAEEGVADHAPEGGATFPPQYLTPNRKFKEKIAAAARKAMERAQEVGVKKRLKKELKAARRKGTH